MFRIKLSKFKQVIAVAIIPRIFVRDTKPIKNKLINYTSDVFNFARKSTDSGSKDDEIEKQRQIERSLGETPQASESKDLKNDSSEMEREHKTLEPSDFVRFSDAEKCDISNASDNEPSHEISGLQTEEASVRATTANIAEETLDQKLEKIVETPNVEVSPQKIEGFNSTSKVLGHDIELFADEKIHKIDLDDLAKRCVGAPICNIDEMLMKEMKNMVNNDIKPRSDINSIKSHCVEKYYSGIFEKFSEQTKITQKVEDTPQEPLNLYFENKSIVDKEIKSERIIPLHIDAVQLLAFEEGSKDYKETGFFRDSSAYLPSNIEEPLLDLPKITPYENPIMPSYEYVNKENVILNDSDDNETLTITETGTDTRSIADVPRAEEVFLNNEDADQPRVVVEKHEMEPGASEPTLSHIVKPSLLSNLKRHNIPSRFGNLSRERLLKLLYLYKNSTDNKTAESHIFSTSIETPPFATINQSPNSAISGTIPEAADDRSKDDSQDMETHPDSAISAHQNPGEYYNMMSLNEEKASYLSEQLRTLTSENHIMHAFCTQLQDMEDGGSIETENSITPLDYPVLLRDPFSYILYEPEIKQKMIDSMKNDAIKANHALPLSQILKRIREKNRLEFCRNLLEKDKLKTPKKFIYMTSGDSDKQKSCPPPCQPPPKPPKEESPKSTPSSCPPPCKPKEDPCAKLIPIFLDTMRFHVPCDVKVPMTHFIGHYYYTSILTEIIERLRNLGETAQYLKGDRDTNYLKDATCTRDFEPWIPIPSWPAPKIEKKRPFVCPKEGCKPVPVPRSNPPKQRPCLGVPKKFFLLVKPV